MNPNPSVVSIKMQKCISDIPISSARGNNNGPRITILGAASINAPAITKTLSITAIKKIGSDEISVKFATICCGICISDNACATGNESAIIGTIIPFTFTEESNIFGISLSDIDFWISPIEIMKTTAIPAASVGVNTPLYMPPKIKTGTATAYFPLYKAWNKIFISNFSELFSKWVNLFTKIFASIIDRSTTMPGMIAAVKSVETEIPITSPIMIYPIDGGIRIPVHEPEAISAAA